MTLTAKEIRERSPEWQKFTSNHDRLWLAGQIIKMKNRPKPELKEVRNECGS